MCSQCTCTGLFRLEWMERKVSELGNVVGEHRVPKCVSVDTRIQILRKCYFFPLRFFSPHITDGGVA